jgi:hypothetical protein
MNPFRLFRRRAVEVDLTCACIAEGSPKADPNVKQRWVERQYRIGERPARLGPCSGCGVTVRLTTVKAWR